jgi:putative acetyltransferase
MSKDIQNTFRPADPNDENALLVVLQGAFHWKPGTKEYENHRCMLAEHIGEFRLTERDGRVVGAVRIAPHWLRIGKAKVLKGDVGEVSVLPEMQGQGLGSAIMTDAVEWMKQERFDLSRLGGLVKFYSRFGYRRFLRRYVEISVGRDTPAGASTVHEGEIPLDNDVQQAVVPYDPAKHGEDYLRLTARNEKYAGFRSEEDITPPESSPLLLVYEENGRAVAYVHAAQRDNEPTEFEAQIGVWRIGYEEDRLDACVALLTHLNNLAHRQTIRRITARLPFAPDLIAALARSPLRFQVIETYGGAAANMLQITNLASLLERMIPEFQSRLSLSPAHDFSGVLEVGIEKDSVQLRFGHGKIQPTTNERPAVRLTVSEFNLMQMTLGLMSYSEVQDILPAPPTDDPMSLGLLASLWPRKVALSDNWG